jgi:uncharacterized protein (UPF0276 family)
MHIAAGVGFKGGHFAEALACTEAGLWFEIHPENYMVAGGARLTQLEALRAQHPVSMHGVSLSLAADAPPDATHLERLAGLVHRFEPFLVSEHLAWSVWNGHYHPDLLPVPRTAEAMVRIAANIQRTQDRLRRRIAIENPSHYVQLDGHDWSESGFLAELARRTGCALLLDLNNVVVSARNLGFDAGDYLDEFPWHAVAEIHLAGHRADAADPDLLIDSHDCPVDGTVWEMHAACIARHGAIPTLIERDGNIPAWPELLAERNRAQAVLQALAEAA